MSIPQLEPGIGEYLRKRLMPVEGVIPHLPGIEMYGNSIPVGSVGGDLFEYINFQQRYNIDARIARAQKLAKKYLEPLPSGQLPRNAIDDHVLWLKAHPEYGPECETPYRRAKSSEQARVAEDLHDLYTTAGVLMVDAQGHGIISAKIASTVHDTFHALMLTELDRHGKTTPELFEKLNLRLAQSVTARNALGRNIEDENAREIATMLYGEVRPGGLFRFVNFGHPPPLVFSAEFGCFVKMDENRMVQFLALGLEIPEDHPDRNKYFSMGMRNRIRSSDIAEITLMSPGDIVFLYTDGVYDGSNHEDRMSIENIVRDRKYQSAREIADAVLAHALEQDDYLRRIGEPDRIDDKTVFIIKRTV
jgi:serine phosphatase RsbU (regulator of sigma subunit)